MSNQTEHPGHDWQENGRPSRREFRHAALPGWLLREVERYEAKDPNDLIWRLWCPPSLLTEEALTTALSLLPAKPLWLDLRHCTTDKKLILSALQENPHLQELTLGHCSLAPEALHQIATLSSLKTLSLSFCNLQDEALIVLSTLPRLRSLGLFGNASLQGEALGSFLGLVQLDLGRCASLTTKALQKISSLQTLEALQLPWTTLDKDALLGLGALSNLLSLDLSWCALPTLPPLPSLRELRLGSTALPVGAASFLWARTRLVSLDISGCSWPEGEVLVAPLSLQALNLSGCKQLTDDLLQKMVGAARLNELNLSGCHQITDATLSSLSGMTSLRRLYLSECPQLTQRAVQTFREEHTSCEVHYY